jgi:hypothetical protein
MAQIFKLKLRHMEAQHIYGNFEIEIIIRGNHIARQLRTKPVYDHIFYMGSKNTLMIDSFELS